MGDLAGHGTWPIHVANILGHVFCAILLFWTMCRMGFPVMAARVSSLFFTIAQIAAFNVLGNDTSGQVWVVAFGGLTLWLAHQRKYPASLATLILTFLCKETSFVFIPLLLATTVLLRQRRVGRDYAALVPIVLLTGFYFLVRHQVGAMNILAGGGAYSYGLGSHNLANLAYSFCGLVLAGLVLSPAGWRKPVAALMLLALLALFPFWLMGHLGESYLNIALFFVAALVGLAAHHLQQVAARHRHGHSALGLAAMILVASNVTAVWSKAAHMRENGVEAYRLLEDLEPFLGHVPPGGRLILEHVAEADEIVYSVYHRPGFLLLGNNKMVPKLVGRPDVDVIVKSKDWNREELIPDRSALVLRDRGGVVEVALHGLGEPGRGGSR